MWTRGEPLKTMGVNRSPGVVAMANHLQEEESQSKKIEGTGMGFWGKSNFCMSLESEKVTMLGEGGERREKPISVKGFKRKMEVGKGTVWKSLPGLVKTKQEDNNVSI